MNYILVVVLVMIAGATIIDIKYNVSFLGINSDRTTDNTPLIQKAISHIQEHHVGALKFYVDRYLTGEDIIYHNSSIRLE